MSKREGGEREKEGEKQKERGEEKKDMKFECPNPIFMYKLAIFW